MTAETELPNEIWAYKVKHNGNLHACYVQFLGDDFGRLTHPVKYTRAIPTSSEDRKAAREALGELFLIALGEGNEAQSRDYDYLFKENEALRDKIAALSADVQASELLKCNHILRAEVNYWRERAEK